MLRAEPKLINQSELLFIEELRDKIKTYEHREYELNGFQYYKFRGYSVRIELKYFLSIKQKLYE